ncbi:MAG TPA: laccase domain-containing protein [Patescibacteria group bacterium]|jgi:copper oxidase (laccase) domain-containing protein|nr:laccase domain-containing protein [Patescibacteria group bacterium]
MIVADQPTCFADSIRVGVSSRQDGTMLDKTREERHHESIVANRRAFCDELGIAYERCVYQIIRYDTGLTYDSIAEVDRPDTDGVWADVLYTEQSGLGLFLPVADCLAVVVHDPARDAIALAHIGRHASIAKTITKAIEFFVSRGSNASDLVVWSAPSVGKQSYRMDYFDHTNDPDWQPFVDTRSDGLYLDLSGYNRQLAIASGVDPAHIFLSNTDTATDENYFSHSQGDTNGRFAVAVMMR